MPRFRAQDWTYLMEMEVHVDKEVDKQKDPRNL